MGTQITCEEYRVKNEYSMQILLAARATRRPILPDTVTPSKQFTTIAWIEVHEASRSSFAVFVSKKRHVIPGGISQLVLSIEDLC